MLSPMQLYMLRCGFSVVVRGGTLSDEVVYSRTEIYVIVNLDIS